MSLMRIVHQMNEVGFHIEVFCVSIQHSIDLYVATNKHVKGSVTLHHSEPFGKRVRQYFSIRLGTSIALADKTKILMFFF